MSASGASTVFHTCAWVFLRVLPTGEEKSQQFVLKTIQRWVFFPPAQVLVGKERIRANPAAFVFAEQLSKKKKKGRNPHKLRWRMQVLPAWTHVVPQRRRALGATVLEKVRFHGRRGGVSCSARSGTSRRNQTVVQTEVQVT